MAKRHHLRRRILIDRRQLQLLGVTLLYVLGTYALFAAVTFGPAALRMLRGQQATPAQAATTAAFLAAHVRFLPVLVVILALISLHSIRSSHRIVGPLYRLRTIFSEVEKGNLTPHTGLRKGDLLEPEAKALANMVGRLDKQFNALATISEIDRTILSSLDIEQIVNTVLVRAASLIPCDALSVTLVSPDQQKVPRTYALKAGADSTWVETTFFNDADLLAFEQNPEHFELGPDDKAPSYLALLARSGCSRYLVLPMFIGERPSGAIAFGFSDDPSFTDDDLERGRQVTDQVAVALSNAHLIEELDALNWGALTALARTVDAKSPWTAGHSERVTAMALKIGRALQLSGNEIEMLHRGGLLHDIGKIGVPAAILDKPSALTDDEYEVIKTHPEIGANILQPIASYADAIPMVRQHHERWNGSGYPDGVAGTDIHFHARIMAVADVYDAMTSERPYRGGLPLDVVIRFIAEGDGSLFDPEVVSAFLDVMIEEGHGALGSSNEGNAVASSA